MIFEKFRIWERNTEQCETLKYLVLKWFRERKILSILILNVFEYICEIRIKFNIVLERFRMNSAYTIKSSKNRAWIFST